MENYQTEVFVWCFNLFVLTCWLVMIFFRYIDKYWIFAIFFDNWKNIICKNRYSSAVHINIYIKKLRPLKRRNETKIKLHYLGCFKKYVHRLTKKNIKKSNKLLYITCICLWINRFFSGSVQGRKYNVWCTMNFTWVSEERSNCYI